MMSMREKVLRLHLGSDVDEPKGSASSNSGVSSKLEVYETMDKDLACKFIEIYQIDYIRE